QLPAGGVDHRLQRGELGEDAERGGAAVLLRKLQLVGGVDLRFQLQRLHRRALQALHRRTVGVDQHDAALEDARGAGEGAHGLPPLLEGGVPPCAAPPPLAAGGARSVLVTSMMVTSWPLNVPLRNTRRILCEPMIAPL